MTDATTQLHLDQMANQVNNLVGELRNGAGAAGKFNDGMKNAERTLSRDLVGGIKGASSSLSELMTSSSSAARYIKGLMGGGLIGTTLGALMNVASDMTDTYRKMTDIGQTFEGSMLTMSIAAAQSGMPLENFANAVMKNSLVLKRMGTRDFPALQRGLLTSMAAQSNFGMTMDGLTDFTAAYWETARTTGKMEHITDKQLIAQTVELAGVQDDMAYATGKAKDAISDLANEAIRSSLSSSRIAMMTDADGIAANQKLQQNMTVLAAQAGEAGKFLSGLAANTYGMDGFSEFTREGQTLIAAGMGHLGALFDDVDNMSVEQTVGAMNTMRSEIGRNLPNLRDLAKGNGANAEAAKELLIVYGEMKDISIEEMRTREKNKDGMTKFLLTIETLWNQIAGSFKTGFLEGFKPLFASVGDFQKSKMFKMLGDSFAALGKALGGVVAGILSEDNVEAFQKNFEALIVGIREFDWKGTLQAIWDFFADINWRDLGSALKSLITFGIELAKLLGPVGGAILLVGGALAFILSPLTMLGGLIKGILKGGGILIKAMGGLSRPFAWISTKLGGLATKFGALSSFTAKLVSGFKWLGGIFAWLMGGGTAATAAGATAAAGAAAGAAGAGAAGAGAAAAGLGSKLLRFGGKAIGGLGGGLMIYDGASSVNTEDKTDKAMGYGESALGGAMLGATIGSLIPIVGTAVGAVVGGGVGLAAAGISDWWSDDVKVANENITKSQEALERQANEREKKPEAQKEDPVISRLDKMVAEQKLSNDLLVSVARSQRTSANEQTRVLNKIAKKDV